MSEIDNTPTSPMKLAKLLGIPPQKIYGLIRQGRIQEVEIEGSNKKLVRPEDVLAVISQKRGPGRPSTHQQLDDFKITPGTVLTWVVEVHKQVSVVESQGDQLVKLRGKLDRRRPKEIYVKKTSLAQHIKDGTITTSQCEGVLEAVVLSWRLNGREEQAAALQAFVDNLEGENNDNEASVSD